MQSKLHSQCIGVHECVALAEPVIYSVPLYQWNPQRRTHRLTVSQPLTIAHAFDVAVADALAKPVPDIVGFSKRQSLKLQLSVGLGNALVNAHSDAFLHL